MERETNPFQASLLVDVSDGNTFRRATLNCALAVHRACSRAGITIELLVHMDPDDQTCHDVLGTVSSWVRLQGKRGVFRSPGDLPADWIRQAKGAYITFLEAPDLVGENWIVQSLKALGELDE